MTEKAGEEAEIDRRLGSLPSDLQVHRKRIWRADEWEAMSREERRRLVFWILKLIDSDAHEALEAETLGIRGEEHVSRTVSLVDEQGWRELNRIQDEALWAILAAKAESTERLAENREEGMFVLSAMLCFELAERPLDAD